MGEYRSRFDLDGRVAVVTGGAGILGRRTTAALRDLGARVAVVDIDGDAAAAHAAVLDEQYGAGAIGFACDVSDPGSVRSLVEQVESQLGPVAVLHNNAATKGDDLSKMFASVADYDLATWRQIMAVNLDGLFLVSQAIGTRMAERGAGSIIHTSSIYGLMGPDQRIYEGSEYLGRPINSPPVYSASKGGVVGLTRYLATYWAASGVRVNAVTPGGIRSGQNKVFEDRYSARIPLGRMAEAEEVAAGVAFLASDAASYITGQDLHIDGGLSAW